MIVISSAGSGLLDRIGASRAASTALVDASTSTLRQSPAAVLPTRVTIGKSDADSTVYSDPRAKPGMTRLWSSPPGRDDPISALMARNRGASSFSLGNQWRGLGGALLAHFAKTGEDYTQTLVDEMTPDPDGELDALPPEEQAQRAAAILARQTAELAGVATDAPRAGLKIQTRSGQSVELEISVNAGLDGVAGIQVGLKASGAMSPAERAAIGQLAEGLDRALEGLGRADTVGLDLSGLMSYDRDAIASVDLKAGNSQPGQALDTFSLHLGDDEQSIALKGRAGELSLKVDTDTPLADTPPLQRRAAIQRALDRMDSAGERGHATTALVRQMKAAFQQLQAAVAMDDGDGEEGRDGKPGAPADPAADGAKAAAAARALSADPLPVTAAPAPVDTDLASRLSGLADFDASFGGATTRRNRLGMVNEAGQAEYQLSQKTTAKEAGRGGRSVAQAVSEQLSADFRRAARPDGLLDGHTGDYFATGVRDSRTVTTLIESTADRVTRVLRKTDEQQLKTVTDIEDHRVAHRQSWPSQRSFMERLR